MTAAGRSLAHLLTQARKLIQDGQPVSEDEVMSLSNDILLAVEDELATEQVTAEILAAPDVLLELRALLVGRPGD